MAVVTILNLSPPKPAIEEEKRNKVSSFPKQLILTVWILDSYEVMDRKVTRAPFLRQLFAKQQLKSVFKAAAKKTIKYFFIYDKISHLHLHDYEEEDDFLGIHFK